MRRTISTFVFLILFVFSLGSALGSDLRKSAVVRAVEEARPAVVNVSTERIVKQASPFGRVGDPWFDQFFRDFFEGSPSMHPYTRTSLGSGVIIRDDGYILTNEHVVLRASKVSVTLLDGRELPATVVGSDPSSDLAILKIDAKNLPTIRVGNSNDLMIGETVIAIGNPFGLSHTVTTGVVSATHRSFRTNEERVFTDFIQTDASINPGNSGGPLLNIDGEMVGINTAIYGNAQGIGFTIPIDRAQRIVENLIHYGQVRHGWIGLRVKSLTYELAQKSGVRVGKGVYVSYVFDNSPAADAGLREGDVVLRVGDVPTGSLEQYRSAIQSVTVGTTEKIDAIRSGEPIAKTFTAREMPAASADEFAWRMMGIAVVPNSPKVAKSYSLRSTQGMVISKVRLQSPAGRTGIQPGDVLLAIGGAPINTLDEFRQVCASLRLAESAIVVVQRNMRAYYLSLQLD